MLKNKKLDDIDIVGPVVTLPEVARNWVFDSR